MKNYLEILEKATLSPKRETRNGTTRSFFYANASWDLRNGFPLVTTKKVAWRAVVEEFYWFMNMKPRENVNIKYLTDRNIHIWDKWADPNGYLGPVYGAQWSRQLPSVIRDINKDPTSRRLLVASWQLDDLDEMALPPCHLYYQFYVDGPYLDLSFVMRSTDIAIGLPFNIASYALVLTYIAYVTGKIPRMLHFTGHDMHIYEVHIPAVYTQLDREPYHMPEVDFNNGIFTLNNYIYHDPIKMEVIA